MTMNISNEEGFVLPKDFENKMKTLLKDEWEEFLSCYTSDKYQALRLNPLKVNTKDDEETKSILEKNGIEQVDIVPWEDNGRYYIESDRVRPGKHPYHEIGLYYIQEPSAMSAARLLDVKPGDKVLDLCAAPGGKSTQLAGFLMDEGLLVANEIHPERSKILSQNMERLGVGNVVVTNEDPAGLSKHFLLFFDKILVDAPCSGEGMFRKNPDAMMEWSMDQVQVCQNRQLDILEEAAKMLVPGGTLVYSTCTFSPEEDEACMGLFLESHPDFEVKKVDAPYFSKAHSEWGNGNEALDSTFRLWPHKLHGEGHFVALIQKKGEKLCSGKRPPMHSKLPDELKEFLSHTSFEIDSDYINIREFRVYHTSPYMAEEKGLRIIRNGLLLGELKKNRFEPSQAFAMALSKEQYDNCIDLDVKDERVIKYLKGETLNIDDFNVENGWALVCVDGFTLGWGKAANGQLKNKYLAGWRMM